MSSFDGPLHVVLAEGLKKKSLSQSQLAAQTGVSQGYISALLAGRKSTPGAAVLARFSSALGISLAELMHAAGKESKIVSRPILIGVSGPSGAGKTFLSQKVKSALPNDVSHLQLDGYFKTLEEVIAEDLEFRFDNPGAIKFDEAIRDVVALKSGREIQVPIRDFNTQADLGFETFLPRPIIVVDGLLLFYNETIRRELDLKIWVDASKDILLERRVYRDANDRGRKVNDILRQVEEEVRPGYEKFIHPLRKYADVQVLNELEVGAGVPVMVEMILSYVQNLPFACRLSQTVAVSLPNSNDHSSDGL